MHARRKDELVAMFKCATVVAVVRSFVHSLTTPAYRQEIQIKPFLWSISLPELPNPYDIYNILIACVKKYDEQKTMESKKKVTAAHLFASKN